MLLPEHDGSFEIHLGSQNPGQKLWVYYVTQVDGQYVFSDGVEITIPNN